MIVGASRTRNASRNMVTGAMGKLVGLFLPFVARTVILYSLGEAYLGIGTLFTSVLSFLSLAELGFSAAITYAMYKPIADGDNAKVCALLNYYKKLYRIIGVVVLVCGLVLLPLIPFLIKGDVPSDLNIYILYSMYLVNSVLSYFIAGYRQGLLSAYQRMDVSNVISLVVTTLVYIIQIIAVIATKNYYVYATVPILGTVAINVSNAIISQRMYPDIQCKGEISKQDKIKIRKKMGGLFGTKLNSMVVHQADILVISAFIGINMVAEYGNYYYIMNAICGFIMIVFTSMTASVGNKIATDSIEENYILFKKMSFFNAWIIGFCSVCFVCLFQPFMKLWVGEAMMLDMLFVILFVVYFFIYEIQRTILTFKDAAGLWYEDRLRPYVSMCFNVASNIILVQIIGIYGIVLSTILAFCISLPWANHVLFKNLFHMNPWKSLLQILKNALITVVACVTTYALTQFCGDGIVGIIEIGFICLLVPNIIFAICNCKNPIFIQLIGSLKKRFTRNGGRC